MRRRALSLLVLTTLALIVPAGVASAAVITGNAGNNTLRGTARADRIDGRAGDDVLLARRASDRLTGGRDDDRLSGGQTGGERYLFGDNWGIDTISDPAGRDSLMFAAARSGSSSTSFRAPRTRPARPTTPARGRSTFLRP